jgi:CheY-like chemotaxis protein
MMMLKCDDMASILIVDDSPEIIRMLQIVLEGRGYHTFAARNGREALNLLQHTKPDLILSDLYMPLVDGLTLLSQVRQDSELHTIPFVVMSAGPTPEMREEVFAAGADAFLAQPIKFDMLNTIIMNLGVVAA